MQPGPSSSVEWTSRARLATARGDWEEALRASDAGQAALGAAPAAEPPSAAEATQRADLWQLRALALEQAERLDAAASCCSRALEAVPDHIATLLTQASLDARQGRRQSALAGFRRAARLAPERAALRHLVASMGGAGFAAPLRGEVESLFDDCADRFDAHLVDHLGYRGHQVLPAAVAGAAGAERASWRALDLGCGSGLCGAGLRPLASHLVGVDLSPRILEHARRRAVYDAVWVADLVYTLVMLPDDAVDLIASADVLGYVGDLEPVFAEAARVLAPGGRLAFTVEVLEAGEAPYRLGPGRRFAFRADYLSGLAREHRLHVEVLEQTALRRESDQDVLEHVAVLRR